ncbi:MAG TPA: sulfurtransferase complex subunit TusD [Methylococcus sp.]|nr:sulfurtransferase complex subunit TusD [Methylococcus sp.]
MTKSSGSAAKPVKFVVQVNASPWQGQGAHSAYQFIKAALAKGHAITRIFFFYDGVFNAQVSSVSMDQDLCERWTDLAREHGVDLVLCVSAAQRRGLLVEEGRAEGRIAPGFRVGGLGQWVEACGKADRVLIFAA